MRALAITGIVTASWMPLTISGSDMRATPPSRRMSAGTRSRAIPAAAPASSAIFACSGVTTSMITPPFNISARPALTGNVASSRCAWPLVLIVNECKQGHPPLGSGIVPESIYERRGDNVYATELTRGPWDPNAQHGGAPAALLMRELERVDDGGLALQFARVTYELVKPVPLGE